MNKKIHIFGGGTVSHLRNHFALCAPAYGTAAKKIAAICREEAKNLDTELHLTKMAGGTMETNEDVSKVLDQVVADPATKIIFLNVAFCDYSGYVCHTDEIALWSEKDEEGQIVYASKYGERLETRSLKGAHVKILAAPKAISNIRRNRKDIFLIGFKSTCGAEAQPQYLAGLNLLKEASCNLVLANDTRTRMNVIITPEEAQYHITTDRDTALKGLVEMALLRSHLTFTRSTVISGQSVPWDSPEVPMALRIVVNHCIGKSAYKPFRGSTVGHFACKLGEKEFLTSKRKTNFNELDKAGLVRIKTDGPDSVIAYGAKPSVGGQSQRIVFSEHPEYDCIVHFHCPLKEKPRDEIPVRSQREFECGSHECGQNTSTGLKKFSVVLNPKVAGLDVPQEMSCVMLDQHGPNIVFHRDTDPLAIIDFIEANFDLSQKTGGYVG